MEVSPAEILDRMSIVKLKIERIGIPELQKEMNALQKAVEDFRERGMDIKEEWISELYEINKSEWDLLDKMNEERKSGEDYEKIGRVYIETEKVNKKRSETKNRIIEETGAGFKEIKKNHPSE
jgi:hypothetical protein